jgi:hypothetical protein
MVGGRVSGCEDERSRQIDGVAARNVAYVTMGAGPPDLLWVQGAVTNMHTGEAERIDDKLGGIAVHIGARVAGVAQSGEVLVSSTVHDLVAGSGIAFADRGFHQLKGIAGDWHLFAVV